MSNRYETDWISKYEQKIIKVLNDLLADEVSPATKRLALHVISDGAIDENGELNNKTCKVGLHYVTPQTKGEINDCLDAPESIADLVGRVKDVDSALTFDPEQQPGSEDRIRIRITIHNTDEPCKTVAYGLGTVTPPDHLLANNRAKDGHPYWQDVLSDLWEQWRESDGTPDSDEDFLELLNDRGWTVEPPSDITVTLSW